MDETVRAAADEARARAKRTYNAAADTYDDPANTFWGRFGQRTIDRLNLPAGAHVLDVCCGSGASALAAAAAVGPSGKVLGIDLAERLLANARGKAQSAGLGNAVFQVGDLLGLSTDTRRFDAVICVFGIFFVPDMVEAVRALWTVVRPAGKLAVTTWGPRFFEPGTTGFWESIRMERPGLVKQFNPWDRICTPAALHDLFSEAGIPSVEIEKESARHRIPSPEAWWAAVMGSGYRGTVELLDAEAKVRIRTANDDYIRVNAIRSVEANVLYAVAVKPAVQEP